MPSNAQAMTDSFAHTLVHMCFLSPRELSFWEKRLSRMVHLTMSSSVRVRKRAMLLYPSLPLLVL